VEEITSHFFPRGLDTDDVEAFEAWRNTLSEERRWADLAQLYASRGEAVDDTVEALHCYLAAADIWEHQAGSHGRAMECLRQVLELEPANRVASEGLKDFFRSHGRHLDLIDLLTAQLDEEDDPARRGALCLEVAEIHERSLRQGQQAVQWYRRASQEDPSASEVALSSLQRLLDGAADPGTLAGLEEVYAGLKQWETVAGVLRRRAELTDEGQAKADLLCDLGELLIDRLDSPDKALEALEQAARLQPLRPERILSELRRLLDARPEDRSVLGALRRVYSSLFRWEEVLELAEREAALVNDREAAALALDMAEIELSRLFRTDRALARFRQAIELDAALAHRVLQRVEAMLRETPDDADARRLLAEVMELTGDWDRLTVVLTDGASIAGRPSDRVAYLCRAAAMALDRLGDSERALALYEQALTEAREAEDTGVAGAVAGLERVLEADPGNRRALTILRDHYTAAEDWEPLVRVLEAEAKLARGPRAEAELHYEIGHVLEERLRRPEAAMSHYQRAFKLNSNDVRYVDAGRRLYRRLGKWDMVVRLLDIELRVTEDEDRRLDILLERGAIHGEHLDDPTVAFRSYLDLLDLAPSHRQALSAAKEILEQEEAGERVLADLERQAALSAPEGAAHFVRVGQLHELDPKNAAGAADAYLRALGLQPEDSGVFRRAESALTDLERWDDLVELYDRAARRALDPRAEEAWRRKAAGVLEDKVGDRRAAARAYRQALELQPGDDALRDRLVRHLKEEEEWAELIQLYRWTLQSVPGLEPDARRRLLRDWAGVCLGPLDDAEAATEPYRLLLRFEPADQEALDFFRSWCRDSGDPAELLAWLDAAAMAAPDAAPDLLAEGAELCETQLSDPAASALRWEDRLRRAPGDERARQALHRLYRDAERWEDVVALLLGEADLARDLPVRLGCLEDAARIAVDRVGDRPRGIELYRRFLHLRPDDAHALEALAELHRESEQWEELGNVLGHLSRLLPEDAASEVLAERARLLRDKLGRPREALADVRRVLAARPEDPVTLKEACELLAAHGDPKELDIMLHRRAQLSGDDEERRSLYSQLARLASAQHRDPARSVEMWRHVLGLAPADPDALGALATLHGQQGEWRELAGVVRRQVEATADDEARVAHLRHLGALYRERLGDLDRAREAWEGVLATDPGDRDAITALQEIHGEREDWAQAAELLERAVTLEADPAKAVTSLRRLASIREGALGDPPGAIAALERAHQLDTDDRGVLTDLRRVLVQAGEPRRAVDTIQMELDAFPEADTVPLCLEAGRTLWRDLDSAEEAAGWYERVLARDPSHDGALTALHTLYDELERTDALVAVLRALLERAEDDSERVELRLELGRRSEEVDGAEAAFDHYKAAHRLDPGREDASVAMRRLAGEHGLWDRLLEVWQGDVVRAGSVEEKLAIVLDSAQVLEEEVGDPERAFSAYRMACTLDPAPGRVLDAMRQLSEEAGLAAQLLPVLETLVDVTEDPADRIPLLYETATLRHRDLDEPEAAFDDLRRAFSLDPGREETHEQVEALSRATGHWEPLLELLSELSGHVRNVAGRVALQHRAARILEEEVGDEERAFEEYVAAFRADPLDEPTERELVRLGETLGRWDRLLVVFRDAAEVVEEPAARARFLARSARVQHVHASDPRAAFDTLVRAFSLDPRAEGLADEMEALAGDQGILPELIEVWDRVASQAPPDLELSLRRRAGRVYEEDLEDPASAIPHLKQIWWLDRGDSQAEARLCDLLREEERFEELLEVHVEEIRTETELAPRLERLFEVADVQHRQFRQPRQAVATLEHVLTLAPGDARARETLQTLHEDLGEPERVVDYLEARAAATDDPAEARDLRLQAAAFWDGRLERPERARGVYRELLDTDPAHEAALDAFEALCERQRWWEDLLGVLELRASLSVDDPERVQLYWRIATLADERFRNRTRAIERLEALLELDPRHRAATERLTDYYRDDGRWTDLLRLLEQRLRRAGDGREQATLLLEIGRVREERLLETEAAIEAYDHAWGLCPTDPRALSALHRLYLAEQRWKEAVATGRALVGVTVDTADAAAIQLRVGQVLLEHIGDLDEALDALDDAVTWVPERVADLRELRRAARGKAEVEVALLELEAEHTPAKDRQAELLCEMGRLLEAEGEHAQAIERYEQALDLRPEHRRALVALTAAYRTLEDWTAVDRCLERTIELLGEGRRDDRDHQARLAEVWTVRGMVALELGERKTAIERLYNALRLDPDARRARRTLAQLAWESERWKVAAEHLRLLSDEPAPEDDDATVAGWYLRLAECHERLDHPGPAVEAWREALLLQPGSQAARRGLAEGLVVLQLWREGADALAVLVDAGTDDADARLSDLRRLGEILTDRLDRPDEGLTRFEEAGRLAPEDPDLLRRLLEGYRRSGNAARAADAAGGLAALATGAGEALDAHLVHGRAALDADRPGEAVGAYARALDHDPTSVEGALGLCEAREGLDDDPGGAAGLDRHLQAVEEAGGAPDPAVLERLASVRGRLDDPEAARDALRAWAGASPDDPASWRALAGALEGDTEHRDELQGALQALVDLLPGDVDAYRALFSAWHEAGSPDRAFPVADLLVFLKAAPAEVTDFYEQYSGWLTKEEVPPLPRPARRAWVDDPVVGNVVGRALDALAAAVPALFTASLEEEGLSDDNRVDGDRQRSLPRRFREVGRSLELEGRALYVRPDGGTALGVLPGDPPAMVVGSDMTRGMFRKEQRFFLARGLMLTLGPRPLARALHEDEGQAIVDALRGGEEGRAGEWAALLAELLPEETHEELRALLAEDPDANFAAWTQAVERSAVRAALVLAGDLGTAFKALRREAGGDFTRPLRDPRSLADLTERSPLARDLLAWALSEAFERLLRGDEPPGEGGEEGR